MDELWCECVMKLKIMSFKNIINSALRSMILQEYAGVHLLLLSCRFLTLAHVRTESVTLSPRQCFHPLSYTGKHSSTSATKVNTVSPGQHRELSGFILSSRSLQQQFGTSGPHFKRPASFLIWSTFSIQPAVLQWVLHCSAEHEGDGPVGFGY